MVKHIIIWNFKDEYTLEEKAAYAEKIKSGLENLINLVPGITEIKVETAPLASSTGDLMLDSTFESIDALSAYQTNPHHVEVATFVRSVVKSRACMDYEV